jgi:hypothetical protein
MFRVLGTAALLGTAFVMVRSLPDLIRYVKMRQM